LGQSQCNNLFCRVQERNPTYCFLIQPRSGVGRLAPFKTTTQEPVMSGSKTEPDLLCFDPTSIRRRSACAFQADDTRTVTSGSKTEPDLLCFDPTSVRRRSAYTFQADDTRTVMSGSETEPDLLKTTQELLCRVQKRNPTYLRQHKNLFFRVQKRNPTYDLFNPTSISLNVNP